MTPGNHVFTTLLITVDTSDLCSNFNINQSMSQTGKHNQYILPANGEGYSGYGDMIV